MAPQATTAASNATMAPQATTAASNATMAPQATTAASNATMAPQATTAASNATMAPQVTMAPNATMAPATTTAPPLTPNTTVTVLQDPVTNTGCGTQQLCAAQPSDCNPNATGSCFFLAARQTSGQNFEFGLSGESDGYLACTLTPSGSTGNDTTYICANDNGTVVFISAFRNGNTLTRTKLNVNNVKGSVNNRTIQCTFAATVPDTSRRAAGFSLSVSTGSFNSTNGALGTPNDQIRTGVVDLTNANQTVTNNVTSTSSTNATTAAPTPVATTGNANTLQQSISQAMLIILGVLSLAML
ncbi:putative ferric-chelate reductase 1 [Sphaeramia orbicularis]|uniref:putative ferric-chelate reductase 1 n=1 Tax=Sphaeramia orbicularis TaxID=375764 RepID=UPI001181739D|nr:putative ferric-chelate reductase 1 [Sphaeramia orbicularis]